MAFSGGENGRPLFTWSDELSCWAAEKVVLSGVASGVDGAAPNTNGFVTLGLRRCLWRYEVDDAERGKPGLGEVVKLADTGCCSLL